MPIPVYQPLQQGEEPVVWTLCGRDRSGRGAGAGARRGHVRRDRICRFP